MTETELMNRAHSAMRGHDVYDHIQSGGRYFKGMTEQNQLVFGTFGFPGDLNGNWILDGHGFDPYSSSMSLLLFHIQILENLP